MSTPRNDMDPTDAEDVRMLLKLLRRDPVFDHHPASAPILRRLDARVAGVTA